MVDGRPEAGPETIVDCANRSAMVDERDTDRGRPSLGCLSQFRCDGYRLSGRWAVGNDLGGVGVGEESVEDEVGGAAERGAGAGCSDS